MSAPANRPDQRPPAGPNGAPPMRIRKPKAADPLVRPKKRPATRPAAPVPSSTATATAAASKPLPPRPTPQATTAPVNSIDNLSANGFSGPLLSKSYVDYPLVTTKRALREGMKHHIARFASKKNIDPRDESQFTRPVRLQRRDPRSRVQDGDDEKGQGQRSGLNSQQSEEAEREELE
ncbi:transcription factor IIF subunit tfg1, partial [Elasticomyces elasticus]